MNNQNTTEETGNGEQEFSRALQRLIEEAICKTLRSTGLMNGEAESHLNKTQRSAAPEKLVFTIQESAKHLALSTKTVYRLIQRGKLRCISSLRHKRIPLSELQRFLKEDLQ